MTYIPMPSPLPVTDVPTGGKSFRRYARNSALGTAYETVDATGSLSPDFRTSAARLEIRSNSAEDTINGAGARTLTLTGLNAAFESLEETIELAGTAVVTTTNLFIRLNNVEVATVGTYGGLPGGGGLDGANIGQITVNYLGSAIIVHTIRPQDGREFSASFCIPKGYYAGITSLTTSIDAGKTCSVTVQVRPKANLVSPPFTPTVLVAELIGVTTGSTATYSPALIIPECTDIYIMGNTTQGTAQMTYTLAGFLAPTV